MHWIHLRPLALAAAITLPTVAAQAAPTSFLDGTVVPGDYTGFTLHTDGSVNLATTAIATGNPGAALAIDYTNRGAGVNLLSVIGLIYGGFSWTPSTGGALASVAFTNDRYIDGGDAFINANLVTSSRALVQQDGRYFIAAILDIGQPRLSWYTNGDSSLSATDFAEIDPLTGLTDASQHPDFSASGSALGFGVLNRFLLDVGGPYALNARFAYDNIGFTMNLARAVPEPGVPSLLAVSMLALALTRRRHRG